MYIFFYYTLVFKNTFQSSKNIIWSMEFEYSRWKYINATKHFAFGIWIDVKYVLTIDSITIHNHGDAACCGDFLFTKWGLEESVPLFIWTLNDEFIVEPL